MVWAQLEGEFQNHYDFPFCPTMWREWEWRAQGFTEWEDAMGVHVPPSLCFNTEIL
jgi:hypothetical protein